jgi:hypothetical protein
MFILGENTCGICSSAPWQICFPTIRVARRSTADFHADSVEQILLAVAIFCLLRRHGNPGKNWLLPRRIHYPVLVARV